MDDRELDDAIRDLVARAAAETPPAPELDDHVVPLRSDGHDRRSRWLLSGATGLGIAAALIGLFLYARTDEVAEPPVVPATDAVTTAPVTVSESTDPSTDTTPDTTDAPTSTTSTTPATTTIPTTTTIPIGAPSELVVAGPDGVLRDGAAVTSEPMAIALPLPDGRTLMQRVSQQSGAVADSAVLVAAPGSTELVPLPTPAEFDGAVLRLHDAAVVGGETIAIVETRPELCPAPEGCDGAIWALAVDSGRLDRLQEKNVWEGGWTRLSLTSAGLVFGAETESATRVVRSWTLPGSEAVPIDLASLGLDEKYGDCTDCPTGFTVDESGRWVGWVETDLETYQTTLVLSPVDATTTSRRIDLVDSGTVCCLDGVGPSLPIAPAVEIEVSGTSTGAGVVRAIVNDEGVLNGEAPRPALTVDLGSGDVSARAGFHVLG